MQHPAETVSSPESPSFAGLLATLTTPAKAVAPAWNEDGLEDDVATLSYERALQARAQYRSAYANDYEPASTTAPGTIGSNEVTQPGPNQASLLDVAAKTDSRAATNAASGASPAQVSHEPHQERNLRSSSITIRLSEAECVQLRERAAEAGLTVSAYLRSCTFEVESLRALVKETMAQLRSATSAEEHIVPAPNSDPAPASAPPQSVRSPWLRGFMRLITPWHAGQRTVRA